MPDSPELLKINPNGMIPVLQDGDFYLYESDAILIYLAEKKGETPLYPKDIKTRALVHRWMFWTLGHFDPAISPILWESLFKERFTGQAGDPKLLSEATEAFRPIAQILNDALAHQDYLVGSSITLADYSVAGMLMYRDAARIPIAEFPHADRWLKRIEASEPWRKATVETPGF
jgi:glutathione S-transferase